jgi:hypothetical protein
MDEASYPMCQTMSPDGFFCTIRSNGSHEGDHVAESDGMKVARWAPGTPGEKPWDDVDLIEDFKPKAL